MNTVEVRGAVKSYGNGKEKDLVLCGLNMTVAEGSIYGMIGSSGCGKTTLLSCILGMSHLDSGFVSVFGHKVVKNKTLEGSRRIGYMPQETALVGELTVKETVHYFGNIFEMNALKLNERFEMIRRLLELPSDGMRVENCSGGEKRRVSFAAAIIHDPDLLVLDEPTVGLDPLLREKIWDFLWHQTRTTKLAVIMTTHYIVEAQKADTVGLMRNGVLLVEDSPANIMARVGTARLEEAFVEFCQQQTAKESLGINKDEVLKSFRGAETETIVDEIENEELKRKLFRWQVITALLSKYVIQFKRQLAGILLLLLFPFLQIYLLDLVMGSEPKGLNLGIVNNEIGSYQECFNSSLITSFPLNDSCHLEKVSCRFLRELNELSLNKIFYKSVDEAFKDAKNKKLSAIIEFDSNFSKAQNLDDHNFDSSMIESSYITIHMDNTDMQIVAFMKSEIFSAYKSYTKKLMESCGLSKTLKNFPMKFEQTFKANIKDYQIPAMIIQMAFFMAAGLISAIIIDDRREGFWNRSILAGVRTTEILVAHSVVCMFIMSLQMTSLVLGFAFVKMRFEGSFYLLLTFLALYGWGGVFFGLFVAATFESHLLSQSSCLCVSTVSFYLSGIVWPLEGFHIAIKWLALVMPFTLPITAISDIVIKGYGLMHPSVLKGLAVIILWNIFSIVTSSVLFRKKKFSRN